jgi:hypothetical protein
MEKYKEEMKDLLAGYREQQRRHVVKLEEMMGIKEIPIYTRLQELKAVIRAFDAAADELDKTNLQLDRIHKKD